MLYNFLNYTTSQRGWQFKKSTARACPSEHFLNCQSPWLVLYFQKVNASQKTRPSGALGGELPFFRARGHALPLISQRFISAFGERTGHKCHEKPLRGARSGPPPTSYQKKTECWTVKKSGMLLQRAKKTTKKAYFLLQAKML